MSHLVIPILVSILLIGIFGSIVFNVYFNQTISDTKTKTAYVIVPTIGLIALLIYIIRTALSDRD